MRGKQWSVEEERQLRQLVEEGRSVDDISKAMGKTVMSVKAKLFNSGLNKLRVATSLGGTVATTTATTPASEASIHRTVTVGGLAIKLREQLSSIEENIRLLDATNALLTDPTADLNRDAVFRLRTVILGVKTYHELYVKYTHIRSLEDELLEVRRQLAAEKNKSTKE